MSFFLKKRPKFAIRKSGIIAPPYGRSAKNGQKAPLQNCEKKGARGCGRPIHAPRAHFLLLSSFLSSLFLGYSFRFLLSFCFYRLPAFFFLSSFSSFSALFLSLFSFSFFLFLSLSIFLFADRAQGARSFNGRPNAAPILAEGGAESRNTGFPGKSAAFCGGGNRKSARANFGWNGRIFLERCPNRNVGPLCFGELSYFRSNPRAPPESQISAGGMSFGIPAGSGGGPEIGLLTEAKWANVAIRAPFQKNPAIPILGPGAQIFVSFFGLPASALLPTTAHRGQNGERR